MGYKKEEKKGTVETVGALKHDLRTIINSITMSYLLGGFLCLTVGNHLYYRTSMNKVKGEKLSINKVIYYIIF